MNAHSFVGKDQDASMPVPVPDRAGGLTVAPGTAIGPSRLGGYPQEQPASGFDLLKYWGLFLKYRWLFAGVAVAALVLGYAATFLSTSIYRATSTIQIDREAAKIVDLKTADPDGRSSSDAQFYQTQYELLRSRSLAERVVADLDLANQKSFLNGTVVSSWTKLHDMLFGETQNVSSQDLASRTGQAVGRVAGGLSIQPVPNSALVRLNFDDPSPEWSQRIVNAVSESFIKSNLEHRYAATSYARNFLQDQLEQIKLKLEQSEKDLVAYAQKQQIIRLDDKQPLAAADVGAINSELARVRALRIRNEQLWKQAQTTDGLGLPQILSDGTIQGLRNKRMLLQSDYQDKLTTFKPDFPDMRKLKNQINEVDKQISSSVDVIKSSIKADYEASMQQEALLSTQLGKNSNELLDVQNRSIQYTILQREVDTNRALYDALLQRYKDVGVAGGVGTNNISVVDSAQIPGGRFSPSLSKNLALALVLGLLAAAAAVFVLELLDDTFKTPEQVEEVLGLSVVGLTPLIDRSSSVKETLNDPHSALSEAFRSVRTALQLSTEAGTPKSLLVTSSRPAEGKSTASLALARNYAQLGLQVLLIDGDLRNPSLHKTLECGNSIGLSNYLAGAVSNDEFFQSTDTNGLTFISSGPLPPNPAELLAGPKLLSLLTMAGQQFDLVIIDGPPVMGLADALVLSNAVAGTLLVVGACETRRNVALNTVKRLHFARAQMVGALLSMFDSRKAGYAYGYGYGYGGTDYYSYGGEKPQLSAPVEA